MACSLARILDNNEPLAAGAPRISVRRGNFEEAGSLSCE